MLFTNVSLFFFKVNYLASDASVRDHMEQAIGTVLNFTEEDLEKIKKNKGHSTEGWF